MGKKIKVSIIEDDKHYREGLEMLINSSGECIVLSSFSSTEEALPNIIKNPPEVALVDIKLPGKSGIELISVIKLRNPEVLCVVCSFYDDDEYVFSALKFGASGYILKDSMPEDILQCILEVYNGGSPMSPYIARKVIATFQNPDTKPVDFQLSVREKEILELLDTRLSNAEISDRLKISTSTVNKHLQNIYNKLHVTSRVDAIKRIKNQNFEFSDPVVESSVSDLEEIEKKKYEYFLGVYMSIFKFIIHDFKRERSLISQKLKLITEESGRILSGVESGKIIGDLANDALNSIENINSVFSFSNTTALGMGKLQNRQLEDLFVCTPYEIVQKISESYKKISIDIASSDKKLCFHYPYPVYYLIIEELVSNAFRMSGDGVKILIKWQIFGTKFQCEIHDDGPGFPFLIPRSFVPLHSISSKKTNSQGFGLKIVEESINSSKGQLLFSNSDILKGALVLFELPIINFNSLPFKP